ELRTMERLDVARGGADRVSLRLSERALGGVQLVGGDLERVDVEAVDLARQAAQRRITIAAHVGDDLGDARLQRFVAGEGGAAQQRLPVGPAESVPVVLLHDKSLKGVRAELR